MGRNHFVTTVDIKNFLFLLLRAKKYARTLILTTITMRLYKMFLYQKIMSDSEMAYNGSKVKIRFLIQYHIFLNYMYPIYSMYDLIRTSQDTKLCPRVWI